jgi:excisionase family DNA binding protein
LVFYQEDIMGYFLTQDQRAAFTVDETVTDQASAILRTVEDEVGPGLALTLQDGRHLPLPGELTRFILGILDDVSQGRHVTVRTVPEELSTSVAASELGVSRPTLMKLIAAGEIAAHKVGTHTRVRFDDLKSYRARREDRIRTAAAELMLLEEHDEE